MRDMKDSGLDWITEIPKDWKVDRLKYKFSFGKGLPITKDNLEDEGIAVISYGQVHSKVNTGTNIDDELIRYVNERYLRTNAQSLVHKNDFIFADTSEDLTGCGNCVYVDKEMQLFAGYHTIILRVLNEDAKYFSYLFLTDEWRKQLREKVSGVKLFSVTQKIIKEAGIIIPPISEQKKITAYLDKKCDEIRLLCNDIQSQISSLEEYKRSVIAEAVTKGLNADVEMKDSGQVWLGKIPSHWMIKPFKYVLMERSHKNDPILTEERLSLSIDKGVTLYAEKTTNLDRFKDDVSQYKLAHKGDLVLNSMNMIVGAVGISNYFGCVSPAYYTYYDNEEEHITARYCEYVFRTPIMQKVLFSLGKGIMAIDRGDGRVNTCRLKVSRDDLRMLHFPVPPVSEQRSIVKRLDGICKEVDAIIEEKKQQLATLEQYKKSLIYEYVTGKKEVPNE